MATWKLPPKEKIYEAFSVIADERYTLGDGKAKVTSSTGKKAYDLEWKDEDQFKVTSNDNASYWQGYIGYPIIALLMILNKITYKKDVVDVFKGINWNDLNKKCNNDYGKVVEKILEALPDQSKISLIKDDVDDIYQQITNLTLEKITKRARPPKESV